MKRHARAQGTTERPERPSTELYFFKRSLGGGGWGQLSGLGALVSLQAAQALGQDECARAGGWREEGLKNTQQLDTGIHSLRKAE